MSGEKVKLAVLPGTKGQEYHPSKAEIIEREGEVLDLLARGERPDAICQKLSGKWKASERTVRRYLTRAYSSLGEAGKVTAKEELGRTLNRLDFLYREAIQYDLGLHADYRLALAVTKERANLLGLYDQPAVPVIQPKNPHETDYESMTDRELTELMIERGIPLNARMIEEAEEMGIDVSKAIREEGLKTIGEEKPPDTSCPTRTISKN
jgi:DNA-binding CsgD family transcriptional regulator